MTSALHFTPCRKISRVRTRRRRSKGCVDEALLLGLCNCGAITVTLIGGYGEGGSYLCHCIGCKKSGGCRTFISSCSCSAVKFLLTATCIVSAVVKASSSDKVKISGTPKKYTQTHGTSSGELTYRYFCGECGSPTHAEGDIAPGKRALKVSLFSEPPPAPAGEGFWRNAAGAVSARDYRCNFSSMVYREQSGRRWWHRRRTSQKDSIQRKTWVRVYLV